MRAHGREERHRHVALVATAPVTVVEGERIDAEFDPQATSGISLLRLSVPARLCLVAAAAVILWGAVAWALA
ncbi:MAG: hypothetical protein JJE37_11325 [Methyloceanibacter sp.]|nr:hypothetical protein [Methyloceanibacter sp.]